MSNTVTISKQWVDNETLHVLGTIALSGSYAAGGESINWDTAGVKCDKDPLHGHFYGLAGYAYNYDLANLKLMIFLPTPGTPAGTIAAHNHSLFLKDASQADAANNRVNAATGKLGANTGADITIAGIPNTSGEGGIVSATTTFTGIAGTAAPMVELTAAAYPAGITGDTIRFHMIFPKV